MSDPVPSQPLHPYGHRSAVKEPSYEPDYISEITFVEHMTDEMVLIVQQTLKLNKEQCAALERRFKQYLNRVL